MRVLERIAANKTSPIKIVSTTPPPSTGIKVKTTNKFLVNHFLFAFGDAHQPLDGTRKVFDEIMTDFITEICFESARSAQLAGRQKVKLDDVKFACRKNPAYLGKMEETIDKKAEIDRAKKLVDVNDDKIIKSGVKALEEELGDADDDADANTGAKIAAGN